MNLNKKYLKKSFIIFFISFFISLIATYLIIKLSNPDISSLENLIINKLSVKDILINNLIVCAVASLGIFTFRITPYLVLVINGLALGFIIGGNYAYTDQLWYFIKIVIPHSIFELPAIFISCSIGLEGFSYLKKYTTKDKVYAILLITSLLIVASFVEVNISTLSI